MCKAICQLVPSWKRPSSPLQLRPSASVASRLSCLTPVLELLNVAYLSAPCRRPPRTHRQHAAHGSVASGLGGLSWALP